MNGTDDRIHAELRAISARMEVDGGTPDAIRMLAALQVLDDRHQPQDKRRVMACCGGCEAEHPDTCTAHAECPVRADIATGLFGETGENL